MTSEVLKSLACAQIDAHRQALIDFGRDILCHPELGFKEHRTSGKVTEAFSALGVQDITHPAQTGVKGWLFRGEGPRVAVIGELDAVLSPQHPHADKATGAAHACGHNAQLSVLLGCAVGLKAVSEALTGSVCLLAAPGEEFIEIGWRSELQKDGKLQYLGGKQELIAEGAFDDIDMAMMVHSETNVPAPRAVVAGEASGFIGKEIQFLGKEAHAGGAPWEGVNALNAATLAMTAIHANRETFRDEDRVRVHPIITKGGDLVNTVPADVRMESYVRAASIEAMGSANGKVNRAVKGAAYAIGAEANIHDIPGYLPMHQNATLSDLFADNVKLLAPELRLERGMTFCGSTDMGDLSYIMPIIQPTVSGFTGAAHSKDFTIQDEELAYILPAKLLAATVIDLLTENAEQGGRILQDAEHHTKEDYANLWQTILK